MYRLRLALPLLLAALLLAAPAAAAPPRQQQPICFPGVPGIADCVAPPLAGYWRDNGGLPVFGYPLAPAGPYAPAGAPAPVTAQWTERNRLELHPENRGPYAVLIGRVGAERLEQLGRDHWADGGEPGPLDGCLWFEATRQNVCDQGAGVGFKSYWEGNGLRIPGLGAYERSLALFGLPLTAANPEPGPDGTLIVTQWFERARFEWHPDKPDEFKVLLGLLGRELIANGAAGAGAPPAAAGPRPSVFGAEINRGYVGGLYGRLREARLSWVRYNGVLWNEVEAAEGRRDWSKLAATDAELAAIAEQGGTTMLVVRGAPAWAQAVCGKVCGPIRPAALDDFATFMGELVARYSGPPYNVKYWELGNEPDAAHQLLAGIEPFGCWGDTRQADYNGAAYAAMLKAVYPAIKAADPAAKVVLGGLLLDCDPTLRPAPKPCGSGAFFEGVLRAGGGDYFDVLAYHSYGYWGPVTSDWDLDTMAWRHRGGALLGKRAFLTEVMGRYGLAKPMIMNEGGLLCYRSAPSCEPGGFYRDQANYAVRLFTRTHATDLLGSIWYTLNGPGWQEGGMLDRRQQPRPAFVATSFLAATLDGASYAGRLGEGALEGHSFSAGGRTVQIYWTNDGSKRAVPLPAGTTALYTMLGEPLGIAGGSVEAGFEPVIILAGG